MSIGRCIDTLGDMRLTKSWMQDASAECLCPRAFSNRLGKITSCTPQSRSDTGARTQAATSST